MTTETHVLRWLQICGPLTLTQLVSRCGDSRYRVRKAVDRLESLACVESWIFRTGRVYRRKA